MCPTCTHEHHRWLDYYATPTPASIRIMQIGTPTVERVIEDRRKRAETKAAHVRTQLDLIRDHCHTHHQQQGEVAA